MSVLDEDIKMLKESGSQFGTYGRSAIKKITLNDEPFLLTSEVWLFGKDVRNLDKIVSFSIITQEDCKGHFGPKSPSGKANLKIPLLHLSRIMIITAQIAAGLIYPEMISVFAETYNVKANNQNLISPPSGVTAIVSDFKFEKNNLIVKAFARANGEPYAEMGKLSLELVPRSKFKRIDNATSRIPNKLLKGYDIKKEMYRSEIEELILEREPFHRLDRAILIESKDGDLRLITVSKIRKGDCNGQTLIDDKPTIVPIDYARLMALTAELLASIVTYQRFNGFSVVPIAVRVDRVFTPNMLFFSPPAIIVAEASISANNLHNPAMIKRGKRIFWADSASIWINETRVAEMDKIVYALIPEDSFLEGKETPKNV